MMKSRQVLSGQSGVFLVEMTIAPAVISTAIVDLMGSFSMIRKSVHYTKSNTLTTNPAQEKTQILKHLPRRVIQP